VSLFENAVRSIQVSVEDLGRNDDARTLSAVRNVHAGTLLLCKEALKRLSPGDGILLAQRFEPRPGRDGTVVVVAVGRNTVGVDDIKRRFKDFGIGLDWKRFDAISDIRNNMEHSYFEGTRERAREAVADACILLRHLLAEILHEDPLQTLGAECWEALLANESLFEEELKSCVQTLGGIEWNTEAARSSVSEIACPACRSSLVRQTDAENRKQDEMRLRCSACGNVAETGAVIEIALGEAFAGEAFAAAKDGGDAPIELCPECGLATYVVAESRCAACDFEVPDGAACAVCGNGLSAEEYSELGGLCSYHANQASKDD
jgi:hypothetical protein